MIIIFPRQKHNLNIPHSFTNKSIWKAQGCLRKTKKDYCVVKQKLSYKNQLKTIHQLTWTIKGIPTDFLGSKIKGGGGGGDAVVHKRVAYGDVLTRDQLYHLLRHHPSHERRHRVQLLSVVPVWRHTVNLVEMQFRQKNFTLRVKQQILPLITKN